MKSEERERSSSRSPPRRSRSLAQQRVSVAVLPAPRQDEDVPGLVLRMQYQQLKDGILLQSLLS